MEKIIVWDMDGTIADLYNVNGWCEALNEGSVLPYLQASPLCDMEKLRCALRILRELGFRNEVVSWSCKNNTSATHSKLVKTAKLEWLKRMGIYDCFDAIHVVKYGTPKHYIPKVRHGVLVDDNKEVRAAWEKYGGNTINPLASDILESLKQIIIENM